MKTETFTLTHCYLKWNVANTATCLPPADVEDMDNESREMFEADVAGLHRYFSKHLELPGHRELLTLFSQVSPSSPPPSAAASAAEAQGPAVALIL